MTEEIKEILNNLRYTAKEHTIQVLENGGMIEHCPQQISTEMRLNSYSARTLLDYITNLQQENERLKQSLFKTANNTNKAMEQTEIYKSRCKKANDFIDNYDVFKEFSFPLMKRDIENQIKSSIDYEFNSTFRKKLKNILNGSDENE